MDSFIKPFKENMPGSLKKHGVSVWMIFTVLVILDAILYLLGVKTVIYSVSIKEIDLLSDFLIISELTSFSLYIIINFRILYIRRISDLDYKDRHKTYNLKYLLKNKIFNYKNPIINRFMAILNFIVMNFGVVLLFLYISNEKMYKHHNSLLLNILLGFYLAFIVVRLISQMNNRKIDDPLDLSTFKNDYINIDFISPDNRNLYFLISKKSMFIDDSFKYIIVKMEKDNSFTIIKGFQNINEAETILNSL